MTSGIDAIKPPTLPVHKMEMLLGTSMTKVSELTEKQGA